MKTGDILRMIGILTYVALTITDRFFFNINDYLYITIAIIGIIMILIGFIMNKK